MRPIRIHTAGIFITIQNPVSSRSVVYRGWRRSSLGIPPSAVVTSACHAQAEFRVFRCTLFTKIRASFMTLKFSVSSPFLFILKLKHLKPMLLKDRTVKHSLPFSPTLSPLALATSLLLKHTIYSNQLRKKIGLLGFHVLEALVCGQLALLLLDL